MKLRRWFPVAALILFALLLGGCINIQQEYWLYEDGSAKVGMDIGMSQALLSMGATGDSGTSSSPFEDLKNESNDSNPNIKNVQVREYTDNDLQHFEVTFEVDDFEQFLAEERIAIHPKKKLLLRVTEGMDVLGKALEITDKAVK